MKKILTAIAAALLLLPAACFAGYVIHLKDGTRFVTDQYFEEGDQIKFKRYGGLFGIEKDRVTEIEEVENLSEEEDKPAETKVPTAMDEAGKQGGAFGDEKEKEKMEEKEIGKPQEMDDTKQKAAEQSRSIYERWAEKKALKVKLNAAIEKVREASKNKDFGRKKEMIEEVRKITKEIHRLTDEVKRTNNGKLPDFWWED